MGLLKHIFTWWDGATIGTALFTRRRGARIGTDALGNVYYEGGSFDPTGESRRWVIYAGANDASRIPPEWNAWLRGREEPAPEGIGRAWQKPPLANLTGTREAYRPAGALEAGGRRAAATGDYEAWSPDA